MPFLQFDLDLLNDLPNISRATGYPLRLPGCEEVEDG